MTPEQEKRFEEGLANEFERVRTSNMRLGALMICNNVLAIANRLEETYEQRINEIIDFCTTTIGKANEKN